MLRRKNAVLVVVDVQTRLLPQIDRNDEILDQIVHLIRGFQIVDAQVIPTEQYRKGLGATHPSIQQALVNRTTQAAPAADGQTSDGILPGFDPIEKMSFSCAGHPPFLEALERSGRRQVVLCGIEAHVCVLQTALHLAEAGYETYVAADAVSSRRRENVDIALIRMEQAGVLFTSVEMAIFEMLEECGTDEFKTWLKVIR